VLQRDSAGARRAAASGSQTQPPPLRWQYRDAGGWADLSLKALPSAEAGQEAVVVSIPANWQSWQGSSVDPTLCWLRLLDADDPAVTPSLSSVMLNAVPAMQQVTMTDDELGSSSGAPNQVFTLARPGVLGEPVLEVCELGVLAPADRAALIEAQGVDAVRTIESFGRLPARTWTRWRRVDDFAASGALSRDFVLDAHEGRVCFGDGRHGRIPPIGANNIVMRRYCCGGGAAGNVAANSIAQLRSTLPYVASVAQPVAATGGTDAESPAASRASATSWLRHRDRAVGPDDYEDLACRAASDVARAKCLPVRDVGADPLARTLAPGCLSLALLPRDAHAPAPQPTADLYARVRAFLRERSASGVRLQLCAPLYVRIDVDAEVVALPSADALALAQTCEERLAEFLHPVRGGPHGEGWEFGRWPHVSELRGALKGVAGLGEVRQLRQRHPQDPPGAATAPHALVCAGRLTMKAVA
jgi:predicted phage baseplate assembly protein